MNNIGERLKQLRIEKGLTQAEVAKALGVNKSCVSKYENDKNLPKAFVLLKMVKFFGVSANYILGLDKNKKLPMN